MFPLQDWPTMYQQETCASYWSMLIAPIHNTAIPLIRDLNILLSKSLCLLSETYIYMYICFCYYWAKLVTVNRSLWSPDAQLGDDQFCKRFWLADLSETSVSVSVTLWLTSTVIWEVGCSSLFFPQLNSSYQGYT